MVVSVMVDVYRTTVDISGMTMVDMSGMTAVATRMTVWTWSAVTVMEIVWKRTNPKHWIRGTTQKCERLINV